MIRRATPLERLISPVDRMLRQIAVYGLRGFVAGLWVRRKSSWNSETDAAETATASGDFEEAARLWREVVDTYGPRSPARAHLQLGIALRESGSIAEAEEALQRGRTLFPDAAGLHIEWAQLPMHTGAFREAVERWRTVRSLLGDEAPPIVFCRLASCHRQLRDLEAAERTLAEALEVFPENVSVLCERATTAEQSGDLTEARRRWQAAFTAAERPSPRLYARLARIHARLKRYGIASAILDHAAAEHPDALAIHFERARLWMSRGDWVHAQEIWRSCIESFGPDVSATPHAQLAICLRERGELQKSAAAVEEGLKHFPDNVDLLVEWADLAMFSRDWPEAARRWQRVADDHPNAPAKMYARLASELGHQGRWDEAERTVERGRKRYPNDRELAIEWAGLAMTMRRWGTATRRWQALLDQHLLDPSRSQLELPTSSPHLHWDENAWYSLVQHWEENDDAVPSPELVAALGRRLDQIGASAHDVERLRRTAERTARTPEVEFVLAVLELAAEKDAPGAPTPPAVASRLFKRLGVSRSGDAHLKVGDLAGSGGDHASTSGGAGLPAIWRLRIPRGSSLELRVRASRYYDERTIDEAVRALSEQEAWPELVPGPNPLAEMARETAAELGRRYERLPYLPAETYADASYFLIYSELWAYEPMRRLARAVAEAAGNEPVFIRQPKGVLRYLNGYGDNSLRFLYFFAELRRAGANAFLCRFEPPENLSSDPPSAPLFLAPGPNLLSGREPGTAHRSSDASVAVIPAGMRSIESVLEQLPRPLLYSSGFLTQRFAYDRLYRNWIPIEPEASILPDRSRLPTTSFDLWPYELIKGADLVRGGSSLGVLERSAALGDDWLSWLHNLLHDAFEDVSKRCHAEITVRQIDEAHISDIHFPESALFASAIRAAGGKVVLWPHSANPVDVEVRRPDSFDEVHAVTRTGCEMWRRHHPGAKVVHSPEIMLGPPSDENPIESSSPLSVIIFGGKSQLGSMPFVHVSQHEESYRRFLHCLAELKTEREVKVYYKPKGKFGDNEAWLRRVAGNTADWEPVLEHPLRISLPNMLFVGISHGSSALLEGLSRSIPCLIVRDFPARDYTTLSADAIPTGTSQEMVEVVRRCTISTGLKALIDEQLEYYCQEIGITQGLTSEH